MSQVVTRAVAAHDKDKDTKRTNSPAKDLRRRVSTGADGTDKKEESKDKSVAKDKPSIAKDKKDDPKDKPAVAKDKKDEPKDKPTVAKDKKEDPKDKPTVAKDKKEDPKDKPTVAKDKKEDSKDKPTVSKDKKDEAKDKNAKVDDKSEKATQNGKSSAKPTNGHGQPVVILTDVNGADNSACVVDDDDVALLDDECFPELEYDDDSERDTPEDRSVTRRSQVKATRTPETPRPASDKDKKDESDQGKDQGKDTKLLKLKEDTPLGRKLRSADKVDKDADKTEEEGTDSRRETNYSKSRVKVSPYRKSANDTTTMANYTGNNTTMEADITESSFSSIPDSALSNSVRARRSYKTLKPVTFEKPNDSVTVVNTQGGRRLCGAVVGRKRKPAASPDPVPAKRHILNKIMSPFISTPQIVGINSDVPLSAPLALDPEVIASPPACPPDTTQHKPAHNRCVVM